MRKFFVAYFAISACSTATGGLDLNGESIKANWLEPNQLQITAVGDNSEESQLLDLAMLKAAEESLAANFQYFEIISSEESADFGIYLMDDVDEWPSFDRSPAGADSTKYSSHADQTNIDPKMISWSTPKLTMMVKLFENKPDLMQGQNLRSIYAADEIYLLHGPQYIKNFEDTNLLLHHSAPMEIKPE